MVPGVGTRHIIYRAAAHLTGPNEHPKTCEKSNNISSNRRCLTTYLGSSATEAMCASWQASTIADMPDMVI
jgi:hypothetical protein